MVLQVVIILGLNVSFPLLAASSVSAGDWMNSTAGLAFTPHIIHVGVGEVCNIPLFLPAYHMWFILL